MMTRSLHFCSQPPCSMAAPADQRLGAKRDDTSPLPVLRANVTVAGDVVRIGDVIDNAGTAAQIAIYRAPDLGTTGSLPTAQVIAALQAHQVIGVDTRDIKAVSVTRLSRTLEAKEIELQVAHALEHRSGLGDAANLSLTFDRDVQDLQLDASNTGALQPVCGALRAAQRPLRRHLRDRQRQRRCADQAALHRHRDRDRRSRGADARRRTQRSPEILRRRDRAAPEGRGRQRRRGARSRRRHADAQAGARRPGAAGADLAKPDLVQRDQNVTLIYESAGLYLTIRGKAIDGGTEGDVVSVLNLQSKRTVSGSRDRPRPGRDLGRDAAAPGRCGPSSTGDRPSSRSGLGRRQQQFATSLQKPSKVHVHVKYQPYRTHRHAADRRQRRRRLLLDRPAVPDRREAETVGDRKSDGAARLQAGADADAEAGSGVLQRQFAVAKRLALVLQGSARRTRSATS